MANNEKPGVTIWHNARCGKSREALALLQGRGVAVTVREYLKEPPTRAEVEGLLDALGGAPADLVRTNEAEFAKAGKTAGALSKKDAAALIAAHPILLQRPVVVSGKKAAIGRPPEEVLKILPGVRTPGRVARRVT